MALEVLAPSRAGELRELIGDPRRAIAELEQAQRSGQVLSADHPRLVDEYEGSWIALHDGTVIARAQTIDELLDELDPETRTHVLVRFIARREQTLIL